DEEILLLPGIGVDLPSQAHTERQILPCLPLILAERAVVEKHRLEVRAFLLSGLRIETDVALRDRVVQCEVVDVVEAILHTGIGVVEQRPCSRTAAAALHNAAYLERMSAAIDTQHVLPILIVLDENGVGEAGAVGRDSGD